MIEAVSGMKCKADSLTGMTDKKGKSRPTPAAYGIARSRYWSIFRKQKPEKRNLAIAGAGQFSPRIRTAA